MKRTKKKVSEQIVELMNIMLVKGDVEIDTYIPNQVVRGRAAIARVLGCSAPSVDNWRRNRGLPAKHNGHQVVAHMDELLEWKANNKKWAGTKKTRTYTQRQGMTPVQSQPLVKVETTSKPATIKDKLTENLRKWK